MSGTHSISAMAFGLLALSGLSQDEETTPIMPKPAQCWEITGPTEIQLLLEKENVLPYTDNIEMSGKRVSGIIRYEVDEEGNLSIDREIYFPQLHHYGSATAGWFHDYRAYLQDNYGDELLPRLYIGDKEFEPGAVERVDIDGTLDFRHAASKSGLVLERSFFPSMDERLFVEYWTLRNTGDEAVTLRSAPGQLTLENFGARGKFVRKVDSDVPAEFTIKPGEEKSFSLRIAAIIEGEKWPEGDGATELAKREAFLAEMAGSLQLETPDPVLNTLFNFSKIRGSESIFESDLGLIHSPGGGRYYVGIWANDQAEYINPFFALLGYDVGNESAMNCFRAFAKETTPDYKNIRYSFEIEGLVKPFPKDRGDAAMIAYGAAQYALGLGDEEIARELWPLIEWCLEYCHRNLNDEGVVKSESDEMESRIETGTANLSTSSLYYGALDHVIDLAAELGRDEKEIATYRERMVALETAIENYFGATVEGLESYKYYKEHEFLRHWICLPLVVGLHERKDATIKGLFENLWSDNGVHVEKNSGNEKVSNIFWDRGTLYALRGTFIAGETAISLDKLQQFSGKRLLGDRVPYVVEAYPEGDMAHLSAESALYCRVFIEGLFGLKPTGFRKFDLTPRLPEGWDTMSLSKIRGFEDNFDLQVNRKGDQVEVVLSRSGETVSTTTAAHGETIEIEL